MILTFKEYDNIVETLEQKDFNTHGWMPTEEEIKNRIEPRLTGPHKKAFLALLIYFDAVADPEKTMENMKSMKGMRELLLENVVFM